MRKQSFLLFALIALIIFQGCKDEKETGCRPLPLDADVSWTEYNSIERLNNFYCNKDALERHKGDTIRFYGWVYIPDTNSSDPYFGDWTADRNYIHLVPTQNHYAQSIILKWDSLWLAHHPDFCSHFDEYLDKKWYVTATIDYNFFGIRCCSRFPIFWAVSIDSIPNPTKCLRQQVPLHTIIDSAKFQAKIDSKR